MNYRPAHSPPDCVLEVEPPADLPFGPIEPIDRFAKAKSTSHLTCEYLPCGEPFENLKKGGRPKKYCGETCKRANAKLKRAETRNLNAPKRETKRAETTEPANRRFDWATSADVIVPEQQAIAVYWNPDGNLEIRQRRAWCEEEDSVVIIDEANAETFLDRLCDLCGIPSVGK